jgi:hypothetical protein
MADAAGLAVCVATIALHGLHAAPPPPTGALFPALGSTKSAVLGRALPSAVPAPNATAARAARAAAANAAFASVFAAAASAGGGPAVTGGGGSDGDGPFGCVSYESSYGSSPPSLGTASDPDTCRSSSPGHTSSTSSAPATPSPPPFFQRLDGPASTAYPAPPSLPPALWPHHQHPMCPHPSHPLERAEGGGGGDALSPKPPLPHPHQRAVRVVHLLDRAAVHLSSDGLSIMCPFEVRTVGLARLGLSTAEVVKRGVVAAEFDLGFGFGGSSLAASARGAPSKPGGALKAGPSARVGKSAASKGAAGLVPGPEAVARGGADKAGVAPALQRPDARPRLARLEMVYDTVAFWRQVEAASGGSGASTSRAASTSRLSTAAAADLSSRAGQGGPGGGRKAWPSDAWGGSTASAGGGGGGGGGEPVAGASRSRAALAVRPSTAEAAARPSASPRAVLEGSLPFALATVNDAWRQLAPSVPGLPLAALLSGLLGLPPAQVNAHPQPHHPAALHPNGPHGVESGPEAKVAAAAHGVAAFLADVGSRRPTSIEATLPGLHGRPGPRVVLEASPLAPAPGGGGSGAGGAPQSLQPLVLLIVHRARD